MVEPGASQCRNIPYAPREIHELAQRRRLLEDALAADSLHCFARIPRELIIYTPALAFETIFSVHLDPYILSLASACVARGHVSPIHMRRHAGDARGARRADRKAGWVYVFWDADEDPRADALKLGATTQTPTARVTQWRRELGHDNVRLLFAHASPTPFWAEEMLHVLLFCQRDRTRINRVSGRPVTEFFRVSDHRALDRLVHAVTLYTRAVRA